VDWVYRQRIGPEWGSGGVFGLTYHKGVLYYTLSMEAEAHFTRDDGYERVYRFELVGPGSASGGDTYNAVETVDEYIYFGGWVHAPAVFKGKRGFIGEIDFRNKYSHLHEYSVYEDRVRLLWSDSIHHEYEWAGEVSSIVYDRVNDELLLARADGTRNLGVYRVSRSSGRAEQASQTPGLKGALFQEYPCFDIQPNWQRGVDGVQCIDPYSRRVLEYRVDNWASISVDGYGVETRTSGYALSAYTRYWHFFRGGLIVGNPLEPDIHPPVFVRLLDFGKTPYGPLRTNPLELAGGLLVVFNSYTHGYLHPPVKTPEELEKVSISSWVSGPTVLLYITPPTARIVLALGARVTSMTKKKNGIVLGTNTEPNLGGLDATPIDTGTRMLVEIPEHVLLTAQSPPIVFKVHGSAIGDNAFGGVPLTGYRDPELRIKASLGNKLEIVEYDIGLPPSRLSEVVYEVKPGVNKIPLRDFKNIVSFRLEKQDPSALIHIVLE
jgi:hypothetical protein